MSKSRNIADLGSNDVLETTSTGVDVTGTVATDYANVYSGVLSEETQLRVGYSSVNNWAFGRENATTGDFFIKSTDASVDTTRLKLHNNGDVSFYEDTGTTPKMTWDASAESLGIGTTSPLVTLHAENTSSGALTEPLMIKNAGTATSTAVGMVFRTSTGSTNTDFKIQAIGTGANAADLKFLSDGDVERMRIDSSGNVGIGTSSPSSPLHISGLGAGYSKLQITETDTATDFVSVVNGGVGYIGMQTNDPLAFLTNDTERARIDSSGNLLVGKTSANGGVDGFEARAAGFTFITTNDSNGACQITERNTGNSGSRKVLIVKGGTFNSVDNTSDLIEFRRGDNTAIGTIQRSGSNGVSYVTSSDYRLKENVTSMDNATDRVKSLKPCRFNFIQDPDTTVDGFIAHEAQEVVPEAVTGSKDAMRTEEYEVSPAVLDDDGNIIEEAVMGTREVPDYQGIDQSKLVPLLTKALQEALTEIDNLKQRVDALENN
jgi:hypothetical protein